MSLAAEQQPTILCHRLGEVEYRQAWELQRQVHAEVVAGGHSRLLLCSHPHVYTKGTRTQSAHLLFPEAHYHAMGADVVATDRGGDVTYHGPGQVVGYPVFRLADFACGKDLHKFLRDIEEVLIRLLAGFGLTASRVAGKTGVWVDGRKVAAIGMRCARWVSMHGFALNVTTDLGFFKAIVPCGLSEPVTSLAELLGDGCPSIEAVEDELILLFRSYFQALLPATQNLMLEDFAT